MGRAVMVGRGPTGAGVLVLSIVIILTTESWGQKGLYHSAVQRQLDELCVTAETRGHADLKCKHRRVDVLWAV